MWRTCKKDSDDLRGCLRRTESAHFPVLGLTVSLEGNGIGADRKSGVQDTLS